MLVEVVQKLFVGLPVSRHSVAPPEGETFSVVSVGDISREAIAPRAELAQISIRVKDVERFFIRTNDVLLSCRGTLLKSARVPPGYEQVVASSNLIVIRPGHAISPHVLIALFRSKIWTDLLTLRARSSTGLMQLTAKDVRDLPVPRVSKEISMAVSELIASEQEYARHAERAIALRHELVTKTCVALLLGRAVR